MAAVYFDVDGTLLQFDRPFDRIFAIACERIGVDPPDGAYETYTGAFFGAFESFSTAPYRTGCSAAVAEHDLDADPGAFAEAVKAVERESTSVPAGTREALAALDADHRLGILSNGVGDVQRAKLAYHDLREPFDVELVSHDLGVMKPDAEIFTIARRRLEADRYVYVADDADADVRPAGENGFLTVHVAESGGNDPATGGDDPATGGDDPVAGGNYPAAAPADLRIRPEEFDRIPEIV